MSIILILETRKYCDRSCSWSDYETYTFHFKHIHFKSGAYLSSSPNVFSLRSTQTFLRNLPIKMYLQHYTNTFVKRWNLQSAAKKNFKDILTRRTPYFQTWNSCATTWGWVPWGPFCTVKYGPDVATWKAFNDLHTLSNIIGEWPSSLVQKYSTNVAENAIAQHGGQWLVSAFTLVINGIMSSD